MPTNKMILNIKSNVAYITFNNPEKHNAVSLDMRDNLEEMLNPIKSFQCCSTIYSGNLEMN